MSSPDHNFRIPSDIGGPAYDQYDTVWLDGSRFRRPHDIEGSTYDPYDDVWPEGGRVEGGPFQPFTGDNHEPVGPDPLFNTTVLVICGALLYTAGSGVYWLWRLAMWVAG